MANEQHPIALEQRDIEGARLFSPSAARNRDPIREAFLRYLPKTGAVLEVGSGTGEHAVHIAGALPDVIWRPGDPDQASAASIAGHISASGLKNIAAPHRIDVAQEGWHEGLAPVDAVVSINMVHIAPFAAAQGLFAGAGHLLSPGAPLILYGPFQKDGRHTAPSNEAFDASLKARDPRWGVRDMEHDLAPLAQEHAFKRSATVEMPSNNYTLVFVKDE